MSRKKKLKARHRFFVKEPKLFLLSLFSYFLLSLLLFDPKLFTGGDNAVYIILAESLAKGSGFKNIYLPDETPHTHYPFGFPLLLSIFVLIFGTNLMILKFFVFLLGICSFYFFYQIVEHLFKENIKLVIPFFITTPIFILYNHWVLSEIPFLCFSLGALYFFIKAQTNKKIFYYISFIFATYSFFIRTAGISLVVGIIFYLLIKKEYKYLGIFLLIFLAVFIPWQIRNSNIPGGGGYIDQFLAKNPYQLELGKIGFFDLIIRVWENFLLYSFTILPGTLLPFMKTGTLIIITGLVSLLFIITGFIKNLKRFSIIELYFIFSLPILLGWPKVWSSDRFLLPVLPIFILYIFSALFWFSEKIKLRYFAIVFSVVFISLNLLEIISQAKISIANNIAYLKGDNYAGYTPDWRHYFETIEWIKNNILEDNIVMARKPEFVYLLSRRKSFSYPFSKDSQKIKEAINKADFILLDNFYWTGTTRRYLLPVLQEEPEKYHIIFQTRKPEFYLLKVIKNKFS